MTEIRKEKRLIPRLSELNKGHLAVLLIYIVYFLAYSEIESTGHYFLLLWRLTYYVEISSFIVVPYLAGVYLKEELLKERTFYIMLGAYEFCLIFSTFINGGDMNGCVYNSAKMLCFILLTAVMIKINREAYLAATLAILWGLSLINFFTVLIYPFPNGMYSSALSDGSMNSWNWFLGYKNSFIRFYFPAAVLGTTYQLIVKNKIFTVVNYFMMFVMFISAYLVHAATSFVGILIIAGFSLFAETIAVRRRISPMIYYAVNVIIFFALIIGNRINSFLAFFVVKVLNKTLTFSNRRVIWDRSIDLIKQHAKFGIGYRNGSDVAQLLGMQHSHNMYLWHGVRGGIPYMLLFAAMLFMAFHNAKKARNQAISQNAMLSLFVIMLMWQFEVFGSSLLIFTVIYLVWNIDKFSRKGDGEYYASRQRERKRGKGKKRGNTGFWDKIK